MLEHEDAVQKLNSLKIQRSSEEPQIEVLRGDISNLTNDLRDLKKVQQSITGEIEKGKNDRNNAAEKMEANRLYLLALKQEINRIKTKIVDNPERLFQVWLLFLFSYLFPTRLSTN